MHQITEQFLLPGIAAALVERQVGATGVRIPTQGVSKEARDAGNFEGLLLKQHYSGSSKDPSLGQAYKVVST